MDTAIPASVQTDHDGTAASSVDARTSDRAQTAVRKPERKPLKEEESRNLQKKSAGSQEKQPMRKEQGSTKGKTETARGKKGKSSNGKNQELGKIGEEMACRYLTDNDIEILERNWKCKSGEADIIATEEETLLFIEVKTRSQGSPGLPEYAVTAQKRARYEKIAITYLMQNQRPSGRIRFDVIAIQMTGERQCLLRHHRDAFGSGE